VLYAGRALAIEVATWAVIVPGEQQYENRQHPDGGDDP